jgi:hypothetical protein
MDCFRSSDNRIRFRTPTGISIQAWQQLTGVNFIFYFGTTFFTNAGIHNPFLISIATSSVNVGMTLAGIWGVERLGRRRLLLVGAVGMTVCELIIAIIGSTTPSSNQSAQSTLVAFVCFYIAFFASTWGPITWVVTGEMGGSEHSFTRASPILALMGQACESAADFTNSDIDRFPPVHVSADFAGSFPRVEASDASGHGIISCHGIARSVTGDGSISFYSYR